MADKVKVFEEQEKKKTPIWTWLIPLLVLLALALWYFTRDRHEPTSAAAPISDQTKPDSGTGGVAPATTAWTAASIADTIRSKGRIGFGDEVHFPTGSATLAGDSQAVLAQTAEALKSNSGWKMRVVGHTDSSGSSATNEQLGQQRATSVMQYLVSHGVDQSRLSVDAKAASQPVSSNTTDTGRAENRRVELIKQ